MRLKLTGLRRLNPDDWNRPDPQPGQGHINPLSPFLDVPLVRFDPSLGAFERASILSGAGVRLVGYLDDHGRHRPGGPSTARVSPEPGTSIEEAITALSQAPGVLSVERDQIVTINATSNDPSFTNGTLWGMMGNQSSPANAAGSQAAEVWALGATGRMTTVVGIIDSGIDYTHSDLYRNIFLNQGEIPISLRVSLVDTDSDGIITFLDLNHAANSAFVTDFNANAYIDAGDLLSDPRWEDGLDTDGNGFVDDLIGWDFLDNDNDPFDLNRHGTHVAGTIGAQGGNAAGVAGVNWDIGMIPLRFLNASGSGAISDAIAALEYYTALSIQYGDIQNFVGTNNSYSSSGFSSALQSAIVSSAQAGQLFFAAAGNAARNIDFFPTYPAAMSTLAGAGYEAVVSVASITSTGARSSFSNFGATRVDLAAPGSAITSTVPGGGYASLNGTSMATPHVTGAAALIASAFPDMTASQIANAILSNTTTSSSLNGLVRTNGRLDLGNIFQALGYTSYTPLAVQSAVLSDTLLASGETLTLTLTFTQPVTGLQLADFQHDTANGSLSSLEVNPGNARQWTVRLTPGAGITDPTNTIGLLAGSYSGPQSEPGPAMTTANFAIDTQAPSVTTFLLPAATLDAGAPAALTMTFTEDVAGLALADFTWNAAAGALTGLTKGAGTTWTATFTPTAGLATASTAITLNAGSYTDTAGNPGSGATTGSFAVVAPPDNTAPQVASITVAPGTIASGQSALVTFTFSEAVSGFQIGDLTFDAAAGTISNLAANPSNAAVWTATFTPATNVSDATNTISVNASSYTDIAGNPGGGGTSANFAVDTLPPAVTTFTRSPAALAWGSTAALSITFTEEVSGLTLQDFTWNAAVGNLSALARVGTTNEWRATFTPLGGLSATSTSVSLTGGSYTDLAGNPGPGGTSPAIAVDTSNAPSTVVGTSLSDHLVGTTANETFYGFPLTDTRNGLGTIDVMTGGGGNDRFVLGNHNSLYYNDFLSTSIGWKDYARITDFGPGDSLQLWSVPRYLLITQASVNTVVVADLDYDGSYSIYDEVIAVLNGVLPSSLTATNQIIDNVTYTIIA